MARNGSAAQLLWTEAADVLIAGARDPLLAARRETLHTFVCLVYDEEVAAAVWENEDARAALLAAAAAGDEDVQCCAHSVLSLIPGQHSYQRLNHTSTSFWLHTPTRQVVLSTARRLAGPDGQRLRIRVRGWGCAAWSEPVTQASPRVRTEAWDALSNSMSVLEGLLRRNRAAEARELFKLLWFDVDEYIQRRAHGHDEAEVEATRAGSAEDVQAVVLSCLTDTEEEDQIKIKALAFLARVHKAQKHSQEHRTYLLHCPDVGGAVLARLPAQLCTAVLACADRTAEASAAPVRAAALALCCDMVEGVEEGDGETAPGNDFKSQMLSVLLGAAEGERAVLDRRLRERCEQTAEKLEMSSADSSQAAVPLRNRRRYSGLSVEERLQRLRQEWERSGEGKPGIRVKVHVGLIGQDMLDLGEKIGRKRDEANHTRISFELDHGVDAGGLTRQCFAEFGKALLEVNEPRRGSKRLRPTESASHCCFLLLLLPTCCCGLLDKACPLRAASRQVTTVSATADALARMKNLLKAFRPPLNANPHEEARLISEVRAALSAQEEATAADVLLADSGAAGTAASDASHLRSSSNGGGGGSGDGGGGGGGGGGVDGSGEMDHDASFGGRPPKRQRSAGTFALPAKMFKLTEGGNLVPSGAETLCNRVGEATDEAGAVVPEVNESTLARYRAIGRVCALALVNNQTLALPFARYFLRLVLREPPTELDDLQIELQAEDPSHLLGKEDFMQAPLADMGMDGGMLSFGRQTSCSLTAPLAKHPATEVTDANKHDYLRRRLAHELVLTIEAQASAFREGVEDVAGVGWLPLLSAEELRLVWGGHQIDDAHLEVWRSKTSVNGRAFVADIFWEWLGTSSEARRAEVLQFATGASRLPCDSQLAAWTFHIEVLVASDVATIEPTATNGLSAPAMLARASTCSKTIQLPPYEDVEALARGMEYSLMDGGFGSA